MFYNIARTERLFSSFFRVTFYGMGFPEKFRVCLADTRTSRAALLAGLPIRLLHVCIFAHTHLKSHVRRSEFSFCQHVCTNPSSPSTGHAEQTQTSIAARNQGRPASPHALVSDLMYSVSKQIYQFFNTPPHPLSTPSLYPPTPPARTKSLSTRARASSSWARSWSAPSGSFPTPKSSRATSRQTAQPRARKCVCATARVRSHPRPKVQTIPAR